MSYSGKVTHLRTGAPISNIPVSDGKNVVLTDENGCFTLEGWERAHVINVSALTRQHNDWFIYIEDHIESYDFVIDPINPVDDFCSGLLSFLVVSCNQTVTVYFFWNVCKV